jgi:hypothetical protein
MAGLGAKLFTAFSKLTAAQVNGYLMDQSIMRFASTAARDAAFGGAGEPTLAEGMTCYLDDTNVLQSYTGSAWVEIASSDGKAPRGVMVFSTKITTDTGSTLNTETTIASGTFTAVANRLYRMTYSEPELTSSAASGSAALMLIKDGTTQIQASYVSIGTSEYMAQTITVTTTLSAGSHTMNARLVRAAPITLTASRSATNPAVFTVEDIGSSL